MKSLSVAIAILVLYISPVQSQVFKLEPKQLNPVDNMTLLRGYNSSTGEVMTDASCVTARPGVKLKEAKTYTTNYHITRGSTAEELHKNVKLDAKVTAGYRGFSGSVQHRDIKNSSSSQYSETLRLAMSVRRPSVNYTNLDVKFRKKDLSFYARCGDMWISGVINGAYALANYSSTAKTAEESRLVHSALQVAFNGFGTKAEASVDQARTESLRLASKHIVATIEQKGPKTKMPKDDPNLIYDYVRKFPDRLTDDDFEPVIYIASRYQDDFIDEPAFLSDEATYVQRLYKRRADLSFVRDNPAQFGPHDPKRVATEINNLSAEIVERTQAMVQCLDLVNAGNRQIAEAAIRKVKPFKEENLTIPCKERLAKLSSKIFLLDTPARIVERFISVAELVTPGETDMIASSDVNDPSVIVEVRGKWHIDPAKAQVIQANSGCVDFPNVGQCFGNVLVVQDRTTKVRREFMDTRAFRLPPSSHLKFRVNSNKSETSNLFYADATNKTAMDPLRIAFYRAVYPEDAPGSVEGLTPAPAGATMTPPPPSAGVPTNPCDLLPEPAKTVCRLTRMPMTVQSAPGAQPDLPSSSPKARLIDPACKIYCGQTFEAVPTNSPSPLPRAVQPFKPIDIH